MLKDLHIAHLTGTATVHENSIFSDAVEFNRPRRNIGQIFFKPYESNKEFIFCARNTVQPAIILAMGILNPIQTLFVPVIFAAVSSACLVFGGLSKCIGNDQSASWWIDMANEVISRLCQAVINLVVLPITALALVTRSISTGLKAVDIYDYDAPKHETPSATYAH